MSTLTRTHSASHSPPSLPSFAQTFPNIAPAADLIKPMHTLPPIHRYHTDPKGKKRSRDEGSERRDEVIDTMRRSSSDLTRKPSLDDVRRREDIADRRRSPPLPVEARRRSSASVKRESLSPTPAPMEVDQLADEQTPSPPRRASKKRRIVPQPSADQERDKDRDSLSPVVVVSTPPSSDQGALEQVRAMLSIKQKQKELIDQRRGSAAGLLQSTPAPPRPALPARRPSAPSAGPSPRTSPKSLPTPATFSNARRRKSANAATTLTTQPPPIARSSTRAAPPRPLMLAPHAHSRRLEPLVHSAPPIGGFGPVRVPSLPPIPITPGLRPSTSTASVAISKSARTPAPVPPTPAYATQQRAGKAGFLQLFDDFYDSLADSRLLKQWLQDQLARSAALLESHEEVIERAVAPLRNEVDGLRRRVGELEEMLLRERQSGYVFPEREREREGEGRLSTSAVRLENAPAANQHRPSPLRSAESAST